MNEINLFVGTPAYGCQVHIDYFNSMMALKTGAIKKGINVDFGLIGNQSLVPKARNALISHVYSHKQYTHLIFIDADIGIPNFCIPHLLSRQVDVIGIPVPLKGYNKDGSPVLNTGDIFNIKDGLGETNYIGNAVLMLSRKAIDSLIEISQPYLLDNNYTRGDQITEKHYDVFKIGVFNIKDKNSDKSIYLSEDYYICYKLKESGYNIYVDLTVPVKHNGMHGFINSEQNLNRIVSQSNSNNNNIWLKMKKENL
jgi:hypothetical protein